MSDPRDNASSILLRALTRVAESFLAEVRGNQLELHRGEMAQCGPMIDAPGLGVVVQEIADLRDDIARLRSDLAALQQRQPTDLIAKREAAKMLGVSPRTIDRLVAEGRLAPGRLVGRRRRWTRAEVEEAAS